MPGRVARSNTAATASGPSKPKTARQKNKKRSLDAYATAQKLIPEKKIARHRLGEIEDDEPRHKRRRNDSEDEDVEEDGDEPRRKRPAQQRKVNGQDDGDLEYGSDSDGNNWTMGGLAEDDEDSDLDSEEAFGASDEERFAGMTFRGSKSGKLKGKRKSVGKMPKRKGGREGSVDLDEGEDSADDSGDSQDEEGLGFGDEAVDLAAMLDDEGSDEDHSGRKKRERRSEESGSEDEDEASEGYEESGSDAEDEEDDDLHDEEKAARMRDRLDALYGDSEADTNARRQQASAATLSDAFAAFDETEEPSAESKKSKKRKKEIKPTTMAAPLPKRQQDRMGREVSSAMAKETMDRWLPTVQRNRRAENLIFPLRHADDQSATIGRDKFQTAAHQVPANEMEGAIQRIMQESGLATQQTEAGAEDGMDEESALLKAEELAEKQIPVEEVMRRRAELRRNRELMFREEKKAARINKIKSKSFRRVHRKERQKQAEQEREAREGEMDESDKEKHDRQRAQARMSTRHKDSKWAKSLKQTNRSAWDDDARGGVIDQARRNEDLKRRIAGKDVSDDDAASDSDSDVDEDVLAGLEQDDGERKGLAGLKFMRTAEERQRKQNQADIDRLRKELAVAEGDEVESEDDEDETIGRAIFGPASKEAKQPRRERLEFEAPDGSDDDEDREEAADGTIVTQKSAQKEKPLPKSILKSGTKSSGPLANGNVHRAEKDSSPKPTAKKSKKNAAVDDIILETDFKDLAQSGTKPGKSVKQMAPGSAAEASNTTGWTTVTYNNGDAASDSEADEPTNGMLSASEAQTAMRQRAFAGDDAEAAFEAEKAELAASEDEKEVSSHLPGWGSWTGDGLSKSIKKANKRAAHNPLYKTKLPGGVKQADRQDAKRGMEKVIVSEKGDRKGKKYLAPVLPHEFETREQYERSRRLPIGPEWTTKEVHQRNVRPRVVVRRGVNGEALERPLV